MAYFKVSVVIPTHNRADLLPRAINSVLAQTYSDIEILVVADGCTDNTSELIKELYGDKVRYIAYNPGKGGDYARNLGVKESIGDYVAFLDDDDEWDSKKIELQMNKVSEDVGLVYTGCNIIYVKENISYFTKPTKEGDLKEDILVDNCIGTTSTVLAKKTLLVDAGLFDEDLSALQDYDLWIRMCQITKVAVISDPLINYYNYTGSKQVSALTQKYLDAFAYIDNKYRDFFDSLSPEKKRRRKIEKVFLLSNKAARNGSPKETRRLLRELNVSEWSIKTVALYLMSFMPFKYSLKLRSAKK